MYYQDRNIIEYYHATNFMNDADFLLKMDKMIKTYESTLRRLNKLINIILVSKCIMTLMGIRGNKEE